MSNSKDAMVAKRDELKRDFMRVAVDTLGSGYVPDYYDQMICSELRWAFELGWNAREEQDGVLVEEIKAAVGK